MCNEMHSDTRTALMSRNKAARMSERLNTFVDFHGEFPKTDPLKEIPGAEVAAMIATGLRERGYSIASVEAVDFEQIITCESADVRFTLYVWIDWELMDRWEICIPSTTGCIGWLFGHTAREELRRLLEAVDKILRNAEGVRDIRWFREFEAACIRDRFKWYPGPISSP